MRILNNLIITNGNLTEIFIAKQFSLAGYKYTMEDVQDSKDWYTIYTITSKQEKKLYKWLYEKTVKLNPLLNDRYIQSSVNMLIFDYGLRVKEYAEETRLNRFFCWLHYIKTR